MQKSSTVLSPLILWFRQDLRLDDNPALAAAVTTGRPIVPVYILDDEGEGGWPAGGASKWWLHFALKDLDDQLNSFGTSLVLGQGDSFEVLQYCLQKTGANSVYWNRRYEPTAIARDQSIKSAFREQGLEVESFNAGLLHEPHTVLKKDRTPYKVFTPFWKCCLTKPKAPLADVKLDSASFFEELPKSVDIEDLELLPKEDWGAGFYDAWDPTRAGARRLLERCLKEKLAGYDVGRDQMGEEGTSKLSPYLHFGQIGPREIWHAIAAASNRKNNHVRRYLAEIGWREFSYYLLYHFPHVADSPLRPEFEEFPWEPDTALLKAWQLGQTGFPIVDAGMRQLWHTGWMHNRARMICASLLVKHLLQPWQDGARWFWDTLVDADLASNSQGWQWTAGCGADASPYFRVFNPILQGQKFDSAGDYVRRWVPELGKLPTHRIHSPWEADASELAEAGLTLGEDYPFPIIDHVAGRARALKAYGLFKVSST